MRTGRFFLLFPKQECLRTVRIFLLFREHLKISEKKSCGGWPQDCENTQLRSLGVNVPLFHVPGRLVKVGCVGQSLKMSVNDGV